MKVDEDAHSCLQPLLGGSSTLWWISPLSRAASSSGILTKLMTGQWVSLLLLYSYSYELSVDVPAGICCNICAIVWGVEAFVWGNTLSRSDCRAASSGRWCNCLTQFIWDEHTWRKLVQDYKLEVWSWPTPHIGWQTLLAEITNLSSRREVIFFLWHFFYFISCVH